MRNILVRLIVCLVLVSATGVAAPQFLDQKTARKEMKARQRDERKAQKLQQRFMKQSAHSNQVPKAERVMMKHELKRSQRELRQRQKDDLQEFKDRQRSIQEARK